MKHYFATDGNYGDADDIFVVDTDEWTNEDFIAVSEEIDYYRIDLAREIAKKYE